MNTRLLKCIRRANPAMVKLRRELDAMPPVKRTIKIRSNIVGIYVNRSIAEHPNIQAAWHSETTYSLRFSREERAIIDPLIRAIVLKWNDNKAVCRFSRRNMSEQERQHETT